MKVWLVGVACSVLAGLSQGFSQDNIQILVGQSKTISVPAGSQVNIGDPSIATARAMANRDQLIITGRSEGETSLTIYLASGALHERLIRVIERDPNAVMADIKEIYGEIEGVEFVIKRGEIVAEGAVYSEYDLGLLYSILDRYAQIINLVDDRSEKLMFNIKVQFVEVNRSKGVDFNNGPLPLGSASFVKESGSAPIWSIAAEANDLFERIAYWESSGIAKVIANPTLTVTNGDTATFLTGGEIPITTRFRDEISIEYKEFGVRLRVAVELTGSGKIMTDITAEVSTVDFSIQNEVTGTPGLLSRRVSNKTIVQEGETIALAGIYQSTIQKSKKRVPVLGHLLPFIFSSKKETEEIKELIVLVTPRVPADFIIDDYPMLKRELQSLK